MLLKKYKKDNRYTTQELAEMFSVSHRTMHTWLHMGDRHIRGKTGSREIYRKRGIEVLAKEAK